jgi:4-amino-4-deoxy-L-arabinose transferase-like glycosyltransferase
LIAKAMPEFLNRLSRKESTHLLVLTMLCGLFFFAPMDLRGLWEPDEARHAEIAREMAESGDWVTTRLNYVKYFEKPIMSFWLLGGSFKLFGVSESAARIVTASTAACVVFFVYFIGRRLWNQSAGFWSAVCLTTSIMFMTIAQVLLVDMPLCLGIVMSFLGVLQLRDDKNRGRYLFWGGAAFGFLSKGALGVALPLLLTLSFALWVREWSLLKKILRLRGILFFIIICAPWYVLVSVRNPEFLPFFWDEHWQRLLTNQHSRWQPPWFYIPFLLGGFLPWIVFLPWAVYKIWPGFKALRHQSQHQVLWVFLWLVIYLLFFSLSSSKMPHYILPLMPALALIVGCPLATFFAYGQDEKNPPFLRRSLAVLAILLLALALGSAVAMEFFTELENFRLSLAALVLPLLLLAASLGIFIWRGHWWMPAVGPVAAMVVVLIFLANIAAPIDNWRSLKGLLNSIALDLRQDDILMSYGDTYYGLAFYGGRRMVVAINWGELDFGRRLDPEQAKWFLPDDDAVFRFIKDSRQRIIVVGKAQAVDEMGKDSGNNPAGLLFEWLRWDNKVILSNQPR